MSAMPLQVLLIGIGNEYRRDDGVGLIVARRLQGQTPPGVSVIEQNGEGAALLEAWRGYSRVLLIDALDCGATPGKLLRLEAHVAAPPRRLFQASTHAFGVAEAVELARALNQLPSRLLLYGIQGQDFNVGKGLSAAVASGIIPVMEQILGELDKR
jgi:hydrogenase maturation protease